MDGPALVEQQEQWTADRRFIFLFPSSRASRSYRAPREISRSPRLAHKAPVMQASLNTSPGSVVHSMMRYLIIYDREAVLWCNKYIDTP